MMTFRLCAVAALTTLLAGCAAAPAPRAAPPPAAAPPPQPRIVQNNSLVGHDASTALTMFGKPRLDITEGAGRKLQFAGAACILDIYYYPAKSGATPVATHVDARTPDGRDATVDSCIMALRR